MEEEVKTQSCKVKVFGIKWHPSSKKSLHDIPKDQIVEIEDIEILDYEPDLTSYITEELANMWGFDNCGWKRIELVS